MTETKNTVINSLPTMAGLNLFLPNPPYMSFPKITAIAPPKAVTCKGVKGANVSPSRIPVTTADKFLTESYFLKNSAEKIHSPATAARTLVRTTNTGCIP